VSRQEFGFIHRFVPGTRPGAVPLLLLHGTGGDENDLIPLGRTLGPGAPLLSPRGQVLENGMPRFFRRFAEQIFDEEDLKLRAELLAQFVVQARQQYRLGDVPPIAVGFSNGANIGAALLLLHPDTLSGGLLFRPTLPLVPDPLPDLTNVPVLLAAARQDPYVAPSQTTALADVLRTAGAEVTVSWSNAAHGLTPEDIQAGERWLTAVGAVR
jgi:predicted esterase